MFTDQTSYQNVSSGDEYIGFSPMADLFSLETHQAFSQTEVQNA